MRGGGRRHRPGASSTPDRRTVSRSGAGVTSADRRVSSARHVRGRERPLEQLGTSGHAEGSSPLPRGMPSACGPSPSPRALPPPSPGTCSRGPETGGAGRRTSAARGSSVTRRCAAAPAAPRGCSASCPSRPGSPAKRAGRSWTWRVGPVEMVHRVEPGADGGATVAIDLSAPGPARAGARAGLRAVDRGVAAPPGAGGGAGGGDAGSVKGRRPVHTDGGGAG